MNASDLAVQIYDDLRQHPFDARAFIRQKLEQLSSAELAELIGASNGPWKSSSPIKAGRPYDGWRPSNKERDEHGN